jgi:hypothetical protein
MRHVLHAIALTFHRDDVNVGDAVLSFAAYWLNRRGSGANATTDCGLGGRVYPQIVWAKLETLVEGAALASKQLRR